ncbi:hypothetical protein ACWDTP_38305 [Mycobacterium sp. NPDC003449]
MQNPSPKPPPPGVRRPIAVGFTRHVGGRTITVRATKAGITGTITPPPPAAQSTTASRRDRDNYPHAAPKPTAAVTA